MCTVQAYAERAKKVNEDKEKEEARREAERLRFDIIEKFWVSSVVINGNLKVWGGEEEEPPTPCGEPWTNPERRGPS